MKPLRYYVQIDKSYFPANMRPKDTTCIFATIAVLATSRALAAEKVWANYGSYWLELMGPKQTTKRVVSLYVDRAAKCCVPARLSPVKVYEG